MAELDGKQQRRALTAAERSLQALGAGNGARAASAAAKAAELDQLGMFRSLPEAVAGAVADLERAGTVAAESWSDLEDAVGPGPLQYLIEDLKG